jgi:hypothetical protein
MRIKCKYQKPIVTVIVNFFNNRREAERTLYSLTSKYQNVSENLYRVIAIDNNSSEPLSNDYVKSFGSNFSYIFYQNEFPSPCKSINYAVKKAKTRYIIICIDGARILSPGILNKMLDVLKYHKKPFVYTVGMHIGDKPQNYSTLEGYCEDVEDELLLTSNWKENGYKLFDISSFALSSKNGFFDSINESNCFMLRKNVFLEIGGYDIRFKSSGGGLCNLHLFNEINEIEHLFKCQLIGEATFHQFHGGVATNVPIDNHPWPMMEEEFFQIFGCQYMKKSSSFFYYK